MKSEGGFTLVFRLADSHASARNSMVMSKRPALGLARTLIENRSAESVLGDRSALNVDPILGRLYVVSSGDYAHTLEIQERLESEGEVEMVYIAPPRDVLIDRTSQSLGSQVFDESWRDLINLAAAMQLAQWKATTRISVAVVDSGIDSAHPQLAHMDYLDHLMPSHRRPDVLGHGSHVAGLIAATPCAENDFKGIAYDCVDLTAHRGLARPHDVGAYYRALRAVTGSRLINLSVGGEHEDPTETELIQDALAEGAIVVAAMGNSQEMGNPTIYPAALDGVVAVSAVDSAGHIAPFSNTGAHISLAAPGVDIRSTVPTYPVPGVAASGRPPLGALSGTSMASPLVTAVFARMLAYKPSLTRMQVIDLINTRLGSTWDQDLGHGIIDVAKLLAAL